MVSKRVMLTTAVLVLPFIPWRSLDAPDWTVLVLNHSDKPAAHVLVREVYRNYSAEWNDTQVDISTDQNGYAHFPAKYIYVSPAVRFLVTLASATGGVHASFGPNAYVFAFDEDGASASPSVNGYEYDWNGKPPNLTSVIRFK